MFIGEIEVDEAYFGGKRKFIHALKRKTLKGKGTAGKAAAVGRKERDSNLRHCVRARNTYTD